MASSGSPKPSKTGKSGRRGFEFTPGSYGDVGNFFASIACMKPNGEYHFVLINKSFTYKLEDEAVDLATQHLDEAFAAKMVAGSDEALAVELATKGYIKVGNFNIVG